MRFLFLLAFWGFFYHTNQAQQIIVELRIDADLRRISLDFPDWKIRPLRSLIPQFHYWLLEYDVQHGTERELLAALRQHPAIRLAQSNHPVELRRPLTTTPNDQQYSDQWQYDNNGSNGGAVDADLDAPEAWDITTGGTTATGERIVIAVIDDGVSTNHPDLDDNLWFNHLEINNNNLDDDQNGYVDDYAGWNSQLQNDDINAGSHGTSVAGIIGARGNNFIGVAGVNWDVDLMIIRNNIQTDEASVLAAYGYALTQRRLYDQTNGARGAFVVATNASWGLNYGQPADAPLWCAFYDTLGKYGILNIAATANLNVDVDAVGDLPTACPSDFLLTVTNVNRLGDKLFSAAYGSTSIDLGAYGESVITTTYMTSYGIFGGTSAAAPHVTGAVGLIYAAACPDFIALAKAHPEQAALLAKQWIMDGVVPESSLNATVSGGCLNLYNSLNVCVNNCPSGCYAPYNAQTASVLDTSLWLQWAVVGQPDSVGIAYRLDGASNWQTLSAVVGDNALFLNGLSGCSTYEVLLWSWCAGVPSDTLVFYLETDGCCHAPTDLITTQITDNQAFVTWDSILAAQSYRLRYRPLGTPTWSYHAASNIPADTLVGLAACTYYEWQVQTLCYGGDSTDWAHTQTFITTGCQSCAAVNYCDARGLNATDDWIQRLQVGDFQHISGNNGGYYLYDNDFIELYQSTQYAVQVAQGEAFLEYYRLWVDWNQDGDFDDALELGVEGTIPYTATANATLAVPADALPGITRLRVALNWTTQPQTCGTYQYGEVEDYCVQIIPSTAVINMNKNDFYINIYPNPVDDVAQVEWQLEQATTSAAIALFSTTGQCLYRRDLGELAAGSQSLHIADWHDLPAGLYLLQYQDDRHSFCIKVEKL